MTLLSAVPYRFNDTVPAYASDPQARVSLLVADCDLYSSTSDILTNLGDRIIPGAALVFDELVNYPEYGLASDYRQEVCSLLKCSLSSGCLAEFSGVLMVF